MGKSEERNKSSRLANYLKEHGFPHGRRRSRPMPNSGGLTAVNRPGSSKMHRLADKQANKGKR